MQSTSASLRVAARLLILAMASLLLVVLGCTGAQAAAQAPATAAATVTAAANPTATATPHASPAMTAMVSSVQDRPACIPGGDKVRLERSAVSPGQALLLHDPAACPGSLLRAAPLDAGPPQSWGRIPTALSHLDLGILRT